MPQVNTHSPIQLPLERAALSTTRGRRPLWPAWWRWLRLSARCGGSFLLTAASDCPNLAPLVMYFSPASLRMHCRAAGCRWTCSPTLPHHCSPPSLASRQVWEGVARLLSELDTMAGFAEVGLEGTSWRLGLRLVSSPLHPAAGGARRPGRVRRGGGRVGLLAAGVVLEAAAVGSIGRFHAQRSAAWAPLAGLACRWRRLPRCPPRC